MSEDRRDAAEVDEDGGGGDEGDEIKALRKTVGNRGERNSEKESLSKRRNKVAIVLGQTKLRNYDECRISRVGFPKNGVFPPVKRRLL